MYRLAHRSRETGPCKYLAFLNTILRQYLIQGGCGALGRWTYTLHGLPAFFVIAIEEDSSVNVTDLGAYVLPSCLDLGKVYQGMFDSLFCFCLQI